MRIRIQDYHYPFPIVEEPDLYEHLQFPEERRAYNKWKESGILMSDDLKAIWAEGEVKEEDFYEVEWFVKTESYQGEGGRSFKTLKEAEKKFYEWSKYNGQLQSKTYEPVAIAIPKTNTTHNQKK